MRNSINLFLTLLFVLIPNNLISQNWITLSDSPSNRCLSIEVIESNANVYKAKIKIHKLKEESMEFQGRSFSRLLFDNNACLHEIGKPALPVIQQFIRIPNGSTYSTSITEIQKVDVSVKPISPAQEPSINQCSIRVLSIVDSIYNGLCYNHPYITASKTMKWRGAENVCFTICPFKYYPAENRLSIIQELLLTINFERSIWGVEGKAILNGKNILNIFDNSKSFSFGSSEIQQEGPARTAAEYDYLIIVGNLPQIENSQAMKDFRKWKAVKGHKTKLVSTLTIGSDSASIKQYIQQEYENGINQVLFVGDHTKIPIPSLSARETQADHQIIKSDYWYGCMDGDSDVQAEIPIGRFLSNTLTEFSNMVSKTIKYESLSHNWADKGLLVANMEGAPRRYQAWLEYIRTYPYSDSIHFCSAYAADTSLHGNNARITDVCNYLNNGMNLFVYNGHGDDDAFWLTPSRDSSIPDIAFTSNDISRLNTETYPIFVSTGCSNGDFTSTNSLMCSMTRSDHCVSSFLGGSAPLFTDAANDYLLEFFDALLNDKLYRLGLLNIIANIRNFDSNQAIDNAFSYICAGDPSLEIWTGEQKTFQQIDMSLASNNILVSLDNNIDGFSVNLISTEGVLLEHAESESGHICVLSKPEGSFYIALDKHNYVPRMVYVDAESQYVQNTIISQDTYYIHKPLFFGYDVTSSLSYGNVTIPSGVKVNVLKGEGVTLKNGFECIKGAEFIVK